MAGRHQSPGSEHVGGGELACRGKIVACPKLLALFDYWNLKRDRRRFAARGDIDPLEIPDLLANILLADIIPPEGRIRFRLVGTSLVEGYGEDFTGCFIDELDYGAERDAVMTEYRLTATSGEPRFSEMEYWNTALRHFWIRRLLLPLSEDQLAVNMLLGIVVLEKWKGRE